MKDASAEVEREVEGGHYRLSVALPALFTTQKGINTPRYPTLPNIMKAKRAQRKDMPMNVQDGTLRRDLSIRDAELNFSLRMIEPKRSFCLTATP